VEKTRSRWIISMDGVKLWSGSNACLDVPDEMY
jgi:hypothetical protein